MNRCLRNAYLLLTLLPSPALARDLYVGVTVVDPATETVHPDSYILVEDGRIIDLGRGKPANIADATLHDFKGLYALPGLIDTHAHVTLGPVRVVTDGPPHLEAPVRTDIIAHNARMLLSFGVTTVRDPGGSLEATRNYSAQVASGALLGPEALHAGELIDRSPVPFVGLIAVPTAEFSIADIVRQQALDGARYAKFYTNLTVADLSEGISAARKNGLKTIAHLGDVSWTRAAELRIDSLVHMMPVSPDLLPETTRASYVANRRPGSFAFFEWYEAADLDAPEIHTMIATLARRHVEVDATLIAFEPAFWGDHPERLNRDLALVHPDMIANWRNLFRFDLGWKVADYQRARAVWPKVLELTRRMYEAGVPMTIGTDMANPYVAPGLSVSQEMALHQQAGIPAWAVLRMATSDAARLLGLGDRIGKLRKGYEADIVFIAADPRRDLASVADVRAVLNNGALLSPEQLRADY